MEKPQSELVRNLEDEIQKLQDETAQLNNRQSVLNEEREFLKSIRLFAGQQLPEDLVTKMPKSEELDSLNNFLKTKWQESFTNEMEIKKEMRAANEKLEKLKKELAQFYQQQGKEKRVISVELEAEKEGEFLVSASYLMYQANWYPEYDARVDYEKEKVELVCLGVVRQNSGEDWTDVELTLSTAKPTISGKMPELESWILEPYSWVEKSKRVDSDNYLMPQKTEMDVEEELMPQEYLREDAAMLYAEAQEKLTSVNYKIARPASIKSDGTKHRLPVFSQELSVKFQYAATPKLSPYPYLLSKVTNQTEQLLPAAVRVFLDDAYVGSSSLDAVGKGEEFELYLGIDEGIKVKREKLKEETDEIIAAGIKRKNKIVKVTYKITAENYKDKDVKINLFDNIPVSQNDQIIVKLLEAAPKPTEEDYQDKNCVERWELTIAPQEKKEIIFTYQVEYPRDWHIEL